MKKVKITLLLLFLFGIKSYSQLSMLNLVELRGINNKLHFENYLKSSSGYYSYVNSNYIKGFESDGLFSIYAYKYTTEWGHPWAPVWIYKNYNNGDIFYHTSFDELKFFSDKLSQYSIKIETLEPNGGAWINHIQYENTRVALFFINSSKTYYVYIT